MLQSTLGRRGFLRGGAAVALATGAVQLPRKAAASDAGDAYEFEVVRTEAEWRDRLSSTEYEILREAGTEPRNSSPHATEEREGIYCCKGCDLTLYESVWKVPLDIGWVFFSHSTPQSTLTSIDGDPPYGMGGEDQVPAIIEAHCRRCGSHLGHVLIAQGQLVHCINGAALDFRASA